MSEKIHRLFSYGTLQYPEVQIETFGRCLNGWATLLPGYQLKVLAISNPEVIRQSGETHHPVAIASNKLEDTVSGMVFEITDAELQQADHYESADYQRIEVTLASGEAAWLYTHKE